MNREKILAAKRKYQVLYRKKHKERIRVQNREYTRANRAKINARHRLRYKEDPEKFRLRSRQKYAKHSEANKDRARAYRAAHPDRIRVYSRRSTLKRRYGLSEAEFHALLREQGNSCLICKMQFSTERLAAVDHCHTSGKVRGILCRQCNTAIALLGEHRNRFERAIEYLERAKASAGRTSVQDIR